MDPDEDHFDPPQCSYTVKVTIVKEVTVRGYPNESTEDMMDKIVEAVHDDLSEDDVTDTEITDTFVWD